MNKETHHEQVLLMDLTKAFDTANRTMLWETLYTKGLTIDQILHKGRGHRKPQLMIERQFRYGPLVGNNIGVFRGSAISDVLFIIYLDDMAEDCDALGKLQMPLRHVKQRRTQEIQNNLTNSLQENTTS